MAVPRIMTIALAAMGGAAVAGEAAPRGESSGSCTLVRILADGRELRSTVSDPGRHAVRVSRGGGMASASARSSSSSAVSVSSSSSFSSSSGRPGRAVARASSSYIDEAGRTVTTIRDNRGCRIVIDEGDQPGEE